MDEDSCQELTLDEARETLFILSRACERYAEGLGKVVGALNT